MFWGGHIILILFLFLFFFSQGKNNFSMVRIKSGNFVKGQAKSWMFVKVTEKSGNIYFLWEKHRAKWSILILLK